MRIKLPSVAKKQKEKNDADFSPSYFSTDDFESTYKSLFYAPPVPDTYDTNNQSLMNSLWCITQYFNPLNHQTRIRNFKLFHSHLIRQTPNLLVVEVALTPDDLVLHDVHSSDKLVQIVDDSMIWQKERIFNMCLKWLPDSCTKIVWMDCDILVDNPGWVYETSTLLNYHKVVQPYFQNARLPATISNIRYGIDINKFPHGFNDDTRSDGEIHAWYRRRRGQMAWEHPGYACGYQRELLEKHGLYDRCIAGSSDQLIYKAIIGDYFNQSVILDRYTEPSLEYYHQWAIPFYNDINLNFNFARQTNLYHLYHGRTDKRQYHSRLLALMELGFDHCADIDIHPDSGLLCFTTDKQQEMQEWLKRYYRKREDDK